MQVYFARKTGVGESHGLRAYFKTVPEYSVPLVMITSDEKEIFPVGTRILVRVLDNNYFKLIKAPQSENLKFKFLKFKIVQNESFDQTFDDFFNQIFRGFDYNVYIYIIHNIFSQDYRAKIIATNEHGYILNIFGQLNPRNLEVGIDNNFERV